MEEALKLKKYPKLTVEKQDSNNYYASLDELSEVRSGIIERDKIKTKHHRYFEFLKALYEKTKIPTAPGSFSLTEFKNQYRVSPLVYKVLIDNHLLDDLSNGSTQRRYHWNTIPPNMSTAMRVVKDIEQLEEQKKENEMVVVNSIAPVGFDVDRFLELLKYHLPIPEKLDYDKINDAIASAIPEPEKFDYASIRDIIQVQLAAIEKINYERIQTLTTKAMEVVGHQLTTSIIHSMHSYFSTELPVLVKQIISELPAQEIREVEKTIEQHHYIDKQEKKSLIDKLFKSKS